MNGMLLFWIVACIVVPTLCYVLGFVHGEREE